MNQIFDIKKVKRNRLWARDHMDGHDFLFQKSAVRIVDNLADIQREFESILIVGERGSEKIKSYFSNKYIELYDLNDENNEEMLGF